MNIVVLGAGRVGTSIAAELSQHEYNVTVVDQDAVLTNKLNDELDIGVVTGNAAQASVLFQAGIPSADVCLAMTGSDEINILAASMAKAMGVRRSIARIYAPVFRDLSTFDYASHFGIDRILSLEHLTAVELARSIRDPSAVIVEQFSRGALDGQQHTITTESKLTNRPLKEVGLPAEIRIGTIERDGRMWIATSEDQLQVGDTVTVFFLPEELKAVRKMFHISAGHKKRIVIGGGGETGFHLARTLEREQYSVMVFEKDPDRCETLVSHLDKTVVVNADASNLDDLLEHRVSNADFFVACTGQDDTNMMQCVEAKEQGVDRILTVIGKRDYVNLAQKLGIDQILSQRDVIARHILVFLTKGAEISRTKLPGGLINVIELEVLPGAPITNAILAETDLPARCLLVAVIQQDVVRLPGGNTRLQPGNVAVLLVEEDVQEEALAYFHPA